MLQIPCENIMHHRLEESIHHCAVVAIAVPSSHMCTNGNNVGSMPKSAHAYRKSQRNLDVMPNCISKEVITMESRDYRRDSDRLAKNLKWQHDQDLRIEYQEKQSSLDLLDQKRYSVVDLFRRYARLHEIPFSVEMGPQRDPDLHTRTRMYGFGKHACTTLGVSTFAVLAVASLELPVSATTLFVISAAVGYLLSLIVNSSIALAAKAGPANPHAERQLRRVAFIAGGGVLGSAGAFMLLRFMSATARSHVSVVLVIFETSVFALGGVLASSQLVCSWSEQLTSEFETLNTERNKLLCRIDAIEAKLPAAAPAVETPTEQSEFEVKHEDRCTILTATGAGGNDTGIRARQGINGVDRS